MAKCNLLHCLDPMYWTGARWRNCGPEQILRLHFPIWELRTGFPAGVIKVAIAVISNLVLS